MTTNTAKVQARMPEDLKARAEKVFEELCISPSDAIRLFYRQVDLRQGIPFDVNIPNETTLAAIRETENLDQLKSFDSVEELLDAI